MDRESCWPAYLWGGIFAVTLMGGAASFGGSAGDWFERHRVPTVVSVPWQGVQVRDDIIAHHHRLRDAKQPT